jgi:hypothetical protein
MKRVFQLYDDPEKTAEAATLAEKNNLCVSAVSPVFSDREGDYTKAFRRNANRRIWIRRLS